MKRAFLHFLSALALIFALGALPWSACACQKASAETHACCPEMGHQGQENRTAHQNPKKSCCVLNCLPKNESVTPALQDISQIIHLPMAPAFHAVLPQTHAENRIRNSNSDLTDLGPPQVYLQKHSFLL